MTIQSMSTRARGIKYIIQMSASIRHKRIIHKLNARLWKTWEANGPSVMAHQHGAAPIPGDAQEMHYVGVEAE